MDNRQPLLPSPSLEQASDNELVARTAQGDARAFEQIMRRHNRLLFRSARSILRSDADAEDAVQEAYLHAWRAMGSFRQDARVSTWLVRIVLNEAFGRVRRRPAQVIALPSSLEPSRSDLDPTEATEANPDERPDRETLRAEFRRLIEARIDALPQAFRTVFVLRAVEELSVDEVAEVLHIPPATVRTRFFRARSLLRESLSRDIDMATEDAFGFAGARCDRIVAGVLGRITTHGLPPPAPCLP